MLSSQGADTRVLVNFARDMTVPGSPLPGGADIGGQHIPLVNVKWPKIDNVPVVINMALPDIIEKASGLGVHALVPQLFDKKRP